MQFEREYRIGIRELGKSNKLSNLGLLEFLEEIASLHSATVGFGINDISETKKSWILMDWKVKIIDRPLYNNVLNIKTWSRGTTRKRGVYTYRDFEVYHNDELVAIASSKWVLLDIEKGMITRLTDDIMDLYQSEERYVFEEPEIEKLEEFEGYEEKTSYTVKRFDIDINNHVHNINYLNIAYEALPENIYNMEELNNIRIMYKHEITYGNTVSCLYKFEDGKHKINIKSEDGEVLHAIVELY